MYIRICFLMYYKFTCVFIIPVEKELIKHCHLAVFALVHIFFTEKRCRTITETVGNMRRTHTTCV